MTYTEVKNALYDWIYNVTGITTIFANENGPRPNLPYITINITAYTKIGQENISNSIETSGVQNISYNEDATVSIQSYGYGSEDILQTLKDSLQKSSILDLLYSDCLVIREDSSITNIALLIDDVIEQRFLYEIIIGFARTITDEPGYIEDVDYVTNIQQPC